MVRDFGTMSRKYLKPPGRWRPSRVMETTILRRLPFLGKVIVTPLAFLFSFILFSLLLAIFFLAGILLYMISPRIVTRAGKVAKNGALEAEYRIREEDES